MLTEVDMCSFYCITRRQISEAYDVNFFGMNQNVYCFLLSLLVCMKAYIEKLASELLISLQ